MRDFFKQTLDKLYVWRGIDQVGKLTQPQLTELLNELVTECDRVEWVRIKPEVKERIIVEAIKSEKDFFGLTVYFVRQALQKFWTTHGGKILELEAQQKDGIKIVERSEEELRRIDIIANGYLEQIKNGGFNVREVPKLSLQEIEQEGQERPKAPTYNTDESYAIEHQKKMRDCQRKIVKDRHPDLNDEEIEKYIDDNL